MKPACAWLVCFLLLFGCARRVSIPSSEEGLSGTEAPAGEQLLAALPDRYMDAGEFRSDPYIRAAGRLQKLGRQAAVKALWELAREKEGNRSIVLCRMLFTRKAAGKFRRPILGAPAFLGGTAYADWPLEPIEVVDGVPFLILKDYQHSWPRESRHHYLGLYGHPESREHYLDYCISHCDWNKVPFETKTPAEKAKALDKLTYSSEWKRPLTEEERAFLAEQVK